MQSQYRVFSYSESLCLPVTTPLRSLHHIRQESTLRHPSNRSIAQIIIETCSDFTLFTFLVFILIDSVKPLLIQAHIVGLQADFLGILLTRARNGLT